MAVNFQNVLPPALRIPISFGANGAPVLQSFVKTPPTSAMSIAVNVPGAYQAAGPNGAGGVVAVIKKPPFAGADTGKYLVLLAKAYSQILQDDVCFQNSATLGVAAPNMEVVTDCTSLQVPQFVKSTGTATALVDAQVTIGSTPNFTANIFTGMVFVDSNSVSWNISSNTTAVLVFSQRANQAIPVPTTPGSGAWSIINPANGLTVTSSSVYAGSVTPVASANAIMTDAGSPAWIVNTLKGQRLVDSVGQVFPIKSNTNGVITILPNASFQAVNTSASAAYSVIQSLGVGAFSPSPRVVTTNAPSGVNDSTDGTGGTNSFTPHAHTNWVAGMFGGMFLTDSAGVVWQITANSTTVLTVASTPVAGVPAVAATPAGPVTGGIWSIWVPQGAGSVELDFSANSAAVGSLTAAAQAFTGNQVGVAPAAMTSKISTASAVWTGNSAAITSATYTGSAPAANSLVGGILSDGTASAIIISNTLFTGASGSGAGTIVVQEFPLAEIATATIPTGGTISASQRNDQVTPSGTNGTSAVTGTVSSSQTGTNPASGEFAVVTLQLA